VRLTPDSVVLGSLAGAIVTVVVTIGAYVWLPPISARRALFVWAVTTLAVTFITAWVARRRSQE
jgi:hypothetical protein